MIMQFEVTEEQYRVILACLQEQPMKVVLDTYVSLQRQAQQVQAAQQPQLRAVEGNENVDE